MIIGDSAEAWSKSVGKILAMKHKVNKIVLDFRKIRNPGERLKGYGWISSGSLSLQNALHSICDILNKKVDSLLDEIDILDIMNHLGLTLSSRRSAEICLMDFENPKWEQFALIKDKHWIDNPQRSQSNNSLVFNKKPSREELERVFHLMELGGGSEPGFINGESARKRKPYFTGVNPCGEQLLADKSFCCLSEIDLSKMNDKSDAEVEYIFKLVARANYRQTCVNLNDGILHRSWDEVNSFLHLVGLGITGIVSWKHCEKAEKLMELRKWASDGIDSMADELNLPRSKGKLNIKPSGTLSKIMGTEESETPEGCHYPIGKYIFNNIRFSRYDSIVEKLRKANYYIFDDPYSSESVLIRFPVCYKHVKFDIVNNVEVNNESALKQLKRYKLLMDNFCDNNCSITVSYSPNEVNQIIDWLLENWDSYVGVSFMYRNDPSKSAKDLGYPYLPQECVTEEAFNSYISTLKEFNLDCEDIENNYSVDTGISCAGGMCPDK
jgi:ribonucleoside-triphosphate reductase